MNIPDKIEALTVIVERLKAEYERQVDGVNHHYVDWGRRQVFYDCDFIMEDVVDALEHLEELVAELEHAVNDAEQQLPVTVAEVLKDTHEHT